MTLLAVLLAVAGSAVLGVVAVTLWEARPGVVHCEMPAPKDARVCSDEAGHAGWHHTAVSRWYGNVQGPPITAPRPAVKVPSVAPKVAVAPPVAPEPIPADQLKTLEPGPEPARLGGPPLRFRRGAMGTRRPITEPL